MIVAPPGEPKARTVPSGAKAIVGEMLLRGCLPGSGELGWGLAGSKSVSSLFKMKPYPGTTMPEPPVASIVLV